MWKIEMEIKLTFLDFLFGAVSGHSGSSGSKHGFSW